MTSQRQKLYLNSKPINSVVIGDGNIGKTCLVTSFLENAYNPKHFPTVFNNYSTAVSFCGNEYDLQIKDTPGQEGYDRLRPLVYGDADCILVCFSVVSRSSFHNIEDKWSKEITNFAPKKPFILVGLKTDLRNHRKTYTNLMSHKETPVTYKEGSDLAKRLRKIGCKKYAECSALNQLGTYNVFDEVLFTVTEQRIKMLRQSHCKIL